MSIQVPDNIQGLDEASAELDRLMAAEAAANGQDDAAATPTQESANAAGQRAAQPETKTTQDQQAEPKADAAQAADTKAKPEEGKGQQQQKDQQANSRYAKARERQEKSWQELNSQKETLRAEREAFEKQRQEFEARRAETEKEFSPEAYDDAAKKFEEAGKLDLAELARAKAADLRKNPPAAKAAAANQQQEAVRKEWALKAGQEFPELVKNNSPLQVRVAQILGQEPDLKAHPKGIYLAARLANLEAAAAGVADKDKELGQLRARVKELEALTAPNPGGGAIQLQPSRTFDQLTDAEQLAELETMARDVGNLR